MLYLWKFSSSIFTHKHKDDIYICIFIIHCLWLSQFRKTDAIVCVCVCLSVLDMCVLSVHDSQILILGYSFTLFIMYFWWDKMFWWTWVPTSTGLAQHYFSSDWIIGMLHQDLIFTWVVGTWIFCAFAASTSFTQLAPLPFCINNALKHLLKKT